MLFVCSTWMTKLVVVTDVMAGELLVTLLVATTYGARTLFGTESPSWEILC